MEKEAVLIYYTCNTHLPSIDEACRKQLKEATSLPIISVSLNEPLEFGDVESIVMEGTRSPEMMHKQVLEGLRIAKSRGFKYAFLVESDVLYHPSHFEFRPKQDGVFYYNTNVWKYLYDDDKFIWTDDLQQVSACVADVDTLLAFYERRNKEIAEKGFDKHYEAGPKTGEVAESWLSWFPNICIRHGQNITKTKKSPEDFKNPEYAKGWKEATEIPGWNNPQRLFK